MKTFVALIAALLLASAAPAFADTGAQSGSLSTAVVSPGQINSPIVQIQNGGVPAITRGATDFHTNAANTAPTVFVNPPSADTCQKPGVGVSGGWVTGNAGVNIPLGASDTCEVRADAINLKVTGAPAAVIKARQCQNPAIAQAYADAGDPCPSRQQVGAAPAGPVAVPPASVTPRQPKPWEAGG